MIMSTDEHNRKNYDSLVSSYNRRARVVPVIGAGLSRWAGYPLWKELLIDMANTFAGDRKEGIVDMVNNFQFEEAAEELKRINKFLFESVLQEKFHPGKIHEGDRPSYQKRLYERFPGTVITTNFDVCLERLYGPDVVVKIPVLKKTEDDKELTNRFISNKAMIIKIHGSIDKMDTLILTKSDYDQAYGTDCDAPSLECIVPKLLKNILSYCIPLFLGCSLGQDRTCSVFKQIFPAEEREDNLFALIEKPKKQSDFEIMKGNMEKMRILPIWYPSGKYKSVDVFIDQFYDDTKTSCAMNPPDAFRPDIVESLIKKAKLDSVYGKYEEALGTCIQAEDLCRRSSDVNYPLFLNVILYKVQVLRQLGYIKDAAFAVEEARMLCEKVKELTVEKPQVLLVLAQVNSELPGHHHMALCYCNEALELLQNYSDREGQIILGRVYELKANILLKEKNLKDAFSAFSSAERLFKDNKDYSDLVDLLHVKSDELKKQNRIEDAMGALNEAAYYCKVLPDGDISLGRTFLRKAVLCAIERNFGEVRKFLEKARALFEKKGYKEGVDEVRFVTILILPPC